MQPTSKFEKLSWNYGVRKNATGKGGHGSRNTRSQSCSTLIQSIAYLPEGTIKKTLTSWSYTHARTPLYHVIRRLTCHAIILYSNLNVERYGYLSSLSLLFTRLFFSLFAPPSAYKDITLLLYSFILCWPIRKH